MKKKLIIYGIGKFAEYVAYAFDSDSDYKVVAFCVEESFHNSNSFCDRPLLKFETLSNHLSSKEHSIFIAVGNNNVRRRILDQALKLNYEIATYISSKCKKWDNLKVGNNCFLDEGCVFQAFTRIEDNCIIFTTDLGHHTVVRANSLMSGAKTGGNVDVGEFSYIGLNASIKQNVSIGAYTVVGMNCAIEKDTPTSSVYSNKGTIKRNLSSAQLGNKFLK